MASTHSLYKHQKRWEKASELQRLASKNQRRINDLKRLCDKYMNKIKFQKQWIKQAESFIEKLKEEKRTNKEELKKYFKKRGVK